MYDSSVSKDSTCNAGDHSLIPGSRRSPGERKGYPLQYSGLENSMDSIVHGVAKSWTRLRDLTSCMYPFDSTTVLGCCSFVASFEIGKYEILTFVVFQGCLSYMGSPAISCEFKDKLVHFC